MIPQGTSLEPHWRIRRRHRFAAQVFGLAPHTAATFTIGREIVRLTCLSGTLWVTCSNDPKDYLVTSGEQFMPRFRGRLVVEAMATSPARFLVQRSDRQ